MESDPMALKRLQIWATDLSREERACALAALGVLMARSTAVLMFLSPGRALFRLELEKACSGADPVPWDLRWLPELAAEVWSKLEGSAQDLAVAWREQVAVRAPRLEVALQETALSHAWLAERLLLPDVGLRSLTFAMPGFEPDPWWRWPLRVGFLADERSAALREQLRGRTLIERMTDEAAETDPGEVLLLPFTLREALAHVLQTAPARRASCVVVLDAVDDRAHEAGSMVAALAACLRASAVITARCAPDAVADWWSDVLYELTHDRPLDEILHGRATGASPPFLFAHPRFVRVTRLSATARRLAGSLAAATRSQPEPLVRLGRKSARALRLAAGTHDARLVFPMLTAVSFDSESNGATAVAGVRRDSGELLESAETSAARDRWVLAQVIELSEPGGRVCTRALRAGAAHEVAVRVGPQGAHWISGPERFPDELLPRDERAHRLTVVFAEPELAPDPQLASIELPAVGDSTTCRFELRTRQDTKRIEARIAVLHRNRVLQTMLLRAPVVTDPEDASPEARIVLAAEAIVRPGMHGLDQRGRFAAALILNHTPAGQPSGTLVSGNDAVRLRLDGLHLVVEALAEDFRTVAEDERVTRTRLDDARSVELLRSIALQGVALHQNVGKHVDKIAPDGPLQIVQADPNTVVPVELIYDLPPPADDAALCANWKKALAAGRCGASHPKNAMGQAKTVCPSGFWGVRRVIERHVLDPQDVVEKLGAADFALRAEPSRERRELPPLASALLGASIRAENAKKNLIQHLFDAIARVAQQASRADTWQDWVKQVKKTRPQLLVLLTHTDDSGSQVALEIGNGEMCALARVTDRFVRATAKSPAPVVLLLGCETGIPTIGLETCVAHFRNMGAAVVIGTLGAVAGHHAAPVAERLTRELTKKSRRADPTFGAVLREARRTLLAQGLLMGLALAGYGDADWQFAKGKS
jgi:hypothetical protein